MVTAHKTAIPFRWRYIILPVVMLLVTLTIIGFFYRILPRDVAYHFAGGMPDGWISRSAIVVGVLVTQALLTLLAVATVWVTLRLSARFPAIPTLLVEKVLTIMGNMVALPQIVLAFAMLNIFSYNAYQIRLMSPLVFALVVMALGLVVLGALFAVAFRQVGAVRGKS